MRTVSFSENGFYHVYNRGVEGRKIFLTKNDYYRFLQILYELNDVIPAQNLVRRGFQECVTRAREGEERKPLVSIMSFCLMPTHFHFLLQPRGEGRLSEFMHRIGVSYARYLNLRLKRKGRLFESTFQAKTVDSDQYLQHVVRYIHLNPLSLSQPHWKERGITDQRIVGETLRRYPWSSYAAYVGEGDRGFLLDQNLITDVISSKGKEHESFVTAWARRSFGEVAPFLFET